MDGGAWWAAIYGVAQSRTWLKWLSSSSSSVKESACQQRRCKRCRFNPWVGKIPWRRNWQHTPIVLSGKLHGQRSLVGYSPQGCKELDTSEHGTFYSTFYLVTVFDAVHFSRVQLFATSWTAACQASLPFTISWSLLKLTSIESVMPSNHLILFPFSPSALNLSRHQGLF